MYRSVVTSCVFSQTSVSKQSTSSITTTDNRSAASELLLSYFFAKLLIRNCKINTMYFQKV